MDFDLSSDQKLLVDTVRSFAHKESPPERLRKLRISASPTADQARGWSKELWKQMGDLGWLALPFPEAHGGLGQGFLEVALVLEQLATSLVPEPYLSSVVLAGMLLAETGTETQCAEWLPRLAAGEISLAFGYAERRARFDANHIETTARREGGSSYVLRGEKSFVWGGNAAEGIIVSARSSGAVADREGISLFMIPKDTPGVRITNLKTTDDRRAATVYLEGVKLPESARLGAEGKAAPFIAHALDRAAAGTCAEAVGVMSEALKMTIGYLGTREQFGVKIGTFQVLQHRAVDMFIETELAKSIALLAAMRADSTDIEERTRAISAAKAHVAVSGRFVVAQGIQLHGGIGISDEHDVGLYFKRMHALSTLFGDEEHHVERFARRPGFAPKEL